MHMTQPQAVIYSFETGLPCSFTTSKNSTLQISTKHYKDGESSLRWDYSSGGIMTIEGAIGFTPFVSNGSDQAKMTFCTWIYNEKHTDGEMKFIFGRNGSCDCFFTMGLSFTGWRAVWVMYERDMQGTPSLDMNTLNIHAPHGLAGGTLYFDQMMMATLVDPRFPTRDHQVPFVNLEADVGPNNHWLSLQLFHDAYDEARQSGWQCNSNPENTNYGSDIARIMNRYEQYVWDKRPSFTRLSMDDLRKQFASYGIKREGEGIKGRSLDLPFFDNYPKACKDELKRLTNSIQVKEFTELMLTVAFAYCEAVEPEHQKELARIFIDLADHMVDQGWATGSAQGTVHHLGYNLLNYYPAIFLMRDVLQNAGKLDQMQQAMFWYSGAGRIFMELSEVEGNIDVFNTTLSGMFASILLINNERQQAALLARFRDWLSVSLLPARGLRAAYKIDGSAFHHVHHYPAYAIGGFTGVAPIVYMMSGTMFRVEEIAHRTLRKALLMMRLYSNKYEWLISLSGRHPTGKWGLDIEPYRYMALAGQPDGNEDIDREVASAYLRLREEGTDGETAEMLASLGIAAESEPNGHWTMNYGSLAIHRRDHWLAGVRGHSRYLLANETYLDCNLYGRYITYGHLQIMKNGNPVSNEASGYVAEGFDWNRWPGTTTIHQPFDKLRSNVRNVDTFSGFEEMLLSDETFAGGLHLDNRHGLFAMKLHEHPKYDGSHRARKSYFFFGNQIVCLGSGIENKDMHHQTETTLFQLHLPEQGIPTIVNGVEVTEDVEFGMTFRGEHAVSLLDHQGVGYYVPKGQCLYVKRDLQLSKHQKNDSDTSGRFASAWIDHGCAPQGATYSYAMIIDMNQEQMERFTEEMTEEMNAPYTVLEQTNAAHIVHDRATGITAYALFDSGENYEFGTVASVDTPCMLMEQNEGDKLKLSVVDPDLRLYEGVEQDQYDHMNQQVEVSVYSRSWVHADSKKHTLHVTLKGRWKLIQDMDHVAVMSYEDHSTLIAVTCQDAIPVQLELTQGILT